MGKMAFSLGGSIGSVALGPYAWPQRSYGRGFAFPQDCLRSLHSLRRSCWGRLRFSTGLPALITFAAAILLGGGQKQKSLWRFAPGFSIFRVSLKSLGGTLCLPGILISFTRSNRWFGSFGN